MRHIAGIVVAAALASAACTTNQPSAPATRTAEISATETADAAILDGAMKSFEQRGYSGLAPHLADLRQALDRAPKDYPVIERVSSSRTVVRSSDLGDGLILMAAVGAVDGRENGQSTVVQVPNVYPNIALILTSEAVERQAYQEAIAYADRGLALQPQHWSLLFEKAGALQGLGRWQDALALADQAIASSDILLAGHEAAFHRRRGFSLIELGRLDEARAAYEKSLELEPGNATAQQELEYIRRLVAGATPTKPVLVNPNRPANN